MNVSRPRRGNRRYAGEEAVGTEGITNLSSMKGNSPNARLMRRRCSLGVACLFVMVIIMSIVFSTRNSGGHDVNAENKLTMPETPEAPTNAYEIVTQQSLDHLKSSAAVYRHKKTGMEVVTMIPADPYQDATFGISFRTPSEKDDGAQYVVEKAILAGSVNYPVKDPFNQLKRGSLQTYSDSWTERDRTAFVISSRNLADFRNNLKVIIDAVFHPLFVDEEYKWIYRQEGWRLESPDGKHLLINGNAYVDAKAAQMDPEEVMIKHLYKNLFSDHVYSKNPKGEASEVVTMTYQEVVAYYETYYHPSNARGFCYGKQDFINTCLNELNVVLDEYEEDMTSRHASKIQWQDATRLTDKIESVAYPDYQETVDYRTLVGWILNEQPMDTRTQVAWHLIYELLAGSNTAIIAKMVYDRDLGTDYTSHFQHSLQQWVMAVGVTGIKSEFDVKKANDGIKREIVKIINEGFDWNAMKAALHKMEFKFRDQSSNEMPRGATFFSDILSHWNYDRDPLAPLSAASEFVALKNEILNDGQDFLLELLTQQVFDNHHATSLDLHPSIDYALQYEKMERDWLNNLDNLISKDEGMKFMSETARLKEVQEDGDTEEALALIPRLDVSELNTTIYSSPSKLIESLFESDIETLEHELPFTNGIAYVDLSLDISNMDFDDVVLIPLFCQLLLEGGTTALDDVKMQQQIDKYTGGITITPVIEEIVETDSEGFYVVPDGKHFVTKLVISGGCIAGDSCQPMLILFRQLIWESDVRNKMKAIEILEARINEMEEDVQTNGHKYTTTRIESRYSLSGFVREQWYGITQLMQMRRALAQIKDNFSDLSLRLVKMQDALKRGHRNGMLMSITGDKESLVNLHGPMRNFLKNSLPLATQRTPFPNFAEEEHPWVPKGLHRVKEEFSAEIANQAFTVPTRVNHVAKGGVLYDVGERIPGSDMVVTQYLGGYYLYNELRFGQGAQEAWALLDLDSGVCIYQSDRDPSIFSTLDVYEGGATWLWKQMNNGELPMEAKGSIVGAIGRMDANIMTEPNQVGKASLISHLKKDQIGNKQRWRDQILGTTAKDFMAMVERLGSWGHQSVCVVTSPETFDTIDQMDFKISRCDYFGYQC